MTQPHPKCRQWFEDLLGDAHAEGYRGQAALDHMARRAGHDAAKSIYAAGQTSDDFAMAEALSLDCRFIDIMVAGGLSGATRAHCLSLMVDARKVRVAELECHFGLWAARDRACEASR